MMARRAKSRFTQVLCWPTKQLVQISSPDSYTELAPFTVDRAARRMLIDRGYEHGSARRDRDLARFWRPQV